MNDPEPTPPIPPNPPSPGPDPEFGVAALLRCAADDELTPRQRAALEAHLAACPEDRARIRFECQLRSACARVMADDAAPEGLRRLVAARMASAVQAAPAQSDVGGSAAPSAAPELEPVVVGRIGPSWLSRFSYAAAAVLLVGLGGALLIRAGLVTQQVTATDAVVVLSSYLSDEHTRFSNSPERFAPKFTVRETSRVPAAVQRILGQPVSVESMEEAGFEFVGLGNCRVPGAERSVHLVFRRTSGMRSGAPVSLFIEPDTGRFDLEEGVTYAVEEGGGGSVRVMAWTHDGLIYYLVTRCAASCDAAKNTLEAPQSLAGLAR